MKITTYISSLCVMIWSFSAQAENGRDALSEAIMNGRSEVVAAILASPQKPDQHALNHALLSASWVMGQTSNEKAHEASPAIITMLAKAGADVNYNPPLTEHRGSPLVLAVYVGNTAAVKALLAAGAKPQQAVNNDGGPVLVMALQAHDSQIVKLLWPYYQPLTAELQNALTEMIGSNSEAENVRMLASLGFKLPQSQVTTDALERAISRGKPDAVSVLLDLGADPNQEVFQGSLLAYAIIAPGAGKEERDAMARMLIAKGAKINPEPKDGSVRQTPIEAAVSMGNLSIVELLVQKGAKLVTPKPENSLLHRLPWFYDKEDDNSKNAVLTILNILVKAGNKIDGPDSQSQTYLASIAGNGFPELLQKVIAYGANVNFIPAQCKTLPPSKKPIQPIAERGDAGSANRMSMDMVESPESQLRRICVSPLHIAISSNNIENARILIGAKANVNLAVPPTGLTPLMSAAINGNPEIVQLLLDSGAEPKAKNLAGQTAAEIAKLLENTRAQSLIENHAR